MLSSLNFEVKTQQYFVSSSDMFLEKKTLLKIWLNPALFVSHSQDLKGQCPDNAYAPASSVFSSKDNRTVILT